MPASELPRIPLTSPTARNEAELTCTMISARAPHSIGTGVLTQHPPRLRLRIFAERKVPSDGRTLIFARPPQLNRGLRGRMSSPSGFSAMSIRSSVAGRFLRMAGNVELQTEVTDVEMR